VEVLHLVFVESGPHHQDFVEKSLISSIILSKLFPNLKSVILLTKIINADHIEAASPRSLKRWEEGRKELRGNEWIRGGMVKLRTLEVGETSER